MVQRLFQEEPEHEKNELMEDSEDEVTSGQSLQHHQSVRHTTSLVLAVLPRDDCEL